jgi:predicted metal-dependent HD superfamily phosphohydrolase
MDIFLDNDLSILGSAPEVYDAYSAAVRLEYCHIEEA